MIENFKVKLFATYVAVLQQQKYRENLNYQDQTSCWYFILLLKESVLKISLYPYQHVAVDKIQQFKCTEHCPLIRKGSFYLVLHPVEPTGKILCKKNTFSKIKILVKWLDQYQRRKQKKKKRAMQSMQLNKIEMCICHRSKGNKFIKTASH